MVRHIIEEIKNKAKSNPQRIVFPEGEDKRIINAVKVLYDEKICIPILIGDTEKIKWYAGEENINLEGIEIIDMNNIPKKEEYETLFFDKRKHKGITKEEIKNLMKFPNYIGVLMVENEDADGMVSGAVHTTANTLRPALQIIKTKPGIKIASSFFIMQVKKRILFFADCGFVINPNAEELSDIATCTAKSVKGFGFEPRVAMLSFSTHGSAKHEEVDKIVEATKIVKKKYPELIIDGELQLDAAIVPEVAESKCPNSILKGDANILIFPDLASGNIGYKLVQRLAGAMAVGPIVQGLNKPVNDLSRGCSIEDIIDVTAITAVEVHKNIEKNKTN